MQENIAGEQSATNPGEISSYADGSYYQGNVLFAEGGVTFSLILNVDDLEIANPLGTSKVDYKMCAVYWSFNGVTL